MVEKLISDKKHKSQNAKKRTSFKILFLNMEVCRANLPKSWQTQFYFAAVNLETLLTINQGWY
jgi:hypothetical protein